MVIIMRSIIRLAPLGRGPKLITERAGPFFPCEMPLIGELDRERERLRLPRLGEYRPILFDRQARQSSKAFR